MRKGLFFTALSIATTIYLLQQLQQPLPLWVNHYVNDFLFLPLTLSLCLFVVRKIKQDPNLQLSLSLILAVTVCYCIYFEWYLPQHNPRYTGDWIDCILYFSGALVFYLLHKTNSKIVEKNK